MFGFNSWSDFTSKAAESLAQASESAKTSLENVSNKTKEFATTFPDNAKSKLSKLQENVSTFVHDQREQYKQVEHETELKKRRKERRAKLLKDGIPPWHVFDEDVNDNEVTGLSNGTNGTDGTDGTNKTTEGKENKKNCTYEELRLLILKLCEDENTFVVEAPSSSSVFAFNMETALPYANAALSYDPILPRIRYKLVPKRVGETQFWKNYFYRVQLIRESMGYPKLDLSATAPSMDQLRRQIVSRTEDEGSNGLNGSNGSNGSNNRKLGVKKNENESKSNGDAIQSIESIESMESTKSIFDQSSGDAPAISTKSDGVNGINGMNGINGVTDKSDKLDKADNRKNGKHVPMDKTESEGEVETNENDINNNLLASVVSLDGSVSSIASLPDVPRVESVQSIQSIQSVTSGGMDENENENEHEVDVRPDEEDDDYMASTDLHVDALTPEARARMTQELGLKGVEKRAKGRNNSSAANRVNSTDAEDAANVVDAVDAVDAVDGDTEDVDALLADVNVDGASDISDDELAKVMSEVENA